MVIQKSYSQGKIIAALRRREGEDSRSLAGSKFVRCAGARRWYRFRSEYYVRRANRNFYLPQILGTTLMRPGASAV